MRKLIGWKDHISEHPNRYKTTKISEGVYTINREPGEVIQQGTPMNADNFNIMDMAALEAMLMAAENTRNLLQLMRSVKGLLGDKIQVTLTNSQVYPFNNSKKTVQLERKNNMDYTVECELVSVTGGAVGIFEISDKLTNGFKIAFTGSAKEVVVNCYVRGGI